MFHRIIALLALAALPAFPVAKEIVQLQRDLSQLQEQVKVVQRTLDERTANLQLLLNQNLEASNRLSTSLALMDKLLQSQEAALSKPVANVNTRIDTLASQFQALQQTVEVMSSRMQEVKDQLADIKNIVSTVPPPQAAPSAPAGPGPQAQADTLLQGARRDYLSGNYNLAGPQFKEYVTKFGDLSSAAEAQYYLGDILFQGDQCGQAVPEFDKLIERYPNTTWTANAQYKKGVCLIKQGRRVEGQRELSDVIKKFPGSEAAAQAANELKHPAPVAPVRSAPKAAPRRK